MNNTEIKRNRHEVKEAIKEARKLREPNRDIIMKFVYTDLEEGVITTHYVAKLLDMSMGELFWKLRGRKKLFHNERNKIFNAINQAIWNKKIVKKEFKEWKGLSNEEKKALGKKDIENAYKKGLQVGQAFSKELNQRSAM